ncbi:histidine kinase [Nonomuraea sp. NPDC046802]|uniref:sensor histidine kinase n=1 Tax=Nonomuraea sp. NPDC046802 TaxID=3154919 RepID=UPI0033E50A7D
MLRDLRGVRVPTAPGSDQPMLRRRLFVVLACGLLIWETLFFAVSGGFGILAVPAAVLVAGPVLWAWHRPVAAWAAMIAAAAVPTVLGLAFDSVVTPQPWYMDQLLAQLPVMYVLALSATVRVTAAAFVLTLAAGAAVALPQDMEPDRLARGLLSWALALAAAVILGYTKRMRRLATLRVAEEVGRLRILEERARIARELHDVVAHHMSVIAVRAASAPYRIPGGVNEEVAREFADLNAAARASIQDMRHLLGVLRGSGDAPRPEEPQTTPQPGLDDLGKLVESVRRAGVPVRLSVADLELSPVQSVTVYRIVQEALSNVVRHAPAAETTVSIASADDRVTVEVDNRPPRRPAAPAPGGSGLGLIGMRERVAVLGGRLTTGPTDEGGFAVRAELPKGDGG